LMAAICISPFRLFLRISHVIFEAHPRLDTPLDLCFILLSSNFFFILSVCHRHPTWGYSLLLYNTARTRLGFYSSFFFP
jgi:hypothetical protein